MEFLILVPHKEMDRGKDIWKSTGEEYLDTYLDEGGVVHEELH